MSQSSKSDKSRNNVWLTVYLEEAKAEFLKIWENEAPSDDNIRNYTLIRTLNSGSFGRVMLACAKGEQAHKKSLAIKIMNKEKIVKMKQVDHTINEKKITMCISHPFIIRTYAAFKDTTNLYLVMDYMNGGELFDLLRKKGKFPEPWCKFYSSQVLLAINYLHNLGILHRDIKPENMLLDYMGYLKLVDFGFAKRVFSHTWTLCGTPQYIAPEIILNKGYSKSVDYWSFGVLIYEMMAGFVPFDHDIPIKLYEMIVACDLKIPSSFNGEVSDLVRNLIQADVTKRYGNLKNGDLDIFDHPWFREVNFEKILDRKVRSPWLPRVKSSFDSSMFSVQKEENIRISKTDKFLDVFRDF